MRERTGAILICWILAALLAGSVPVAAQAPAAEPEPAGPAAATAAEPPAAEPPATEPPATEPPTAEPPAAEPAASEPASPPASAPTTAAEAVSGAVEETADTLASGGAQVAEEGRRLWTEALVPIWHRLAAAIPILIKALLIFAVFWAIAVGLAFVVRKALDATSVDERLAHELGMGGFLAPEGREPRSTSGIASTAVKWIVLTFGIVAVLNTLQLGMVAGPLQNVLDKIVAIVPSLLKAALILVIYWLVATLLKLAATRGLAAVGFDEKAGKFIASREIGGEKIGPSGMVGRLAFYAVLLFGIPPFLDALGQRALVAPLQEMFGKVLDFLPNVVAALILFAIGRIIATIIREVVTNFLAAIGVDRFAERFGFGDGSKKLSEVGGAIAFFFVIIPVLVAAVDSLQMKAISEPVKGTLEQLLSAVPLIFVALVVVAIGLFIAKAVRGIVESFLSGVGFDSLPERFGLGFLAPRGEGVTLSSIGGTVVAAIILLLTAEQALATLRLGELATLVGGLIHYLPSLAVGLVIILVALSLGSYVADIVRKALSDSAHGALAAAIARYAIIFLGFSMGLSQLGVGREVLTVAVSAVMGGVALALGLAFGLGGRERAKALIEERTSDP